MPEHRERRRSFVLPEKKLNYKTNEPSLAGLYETGPYPAALKKSVTGPNIFETDHPCAGRFFCQKDAASVIEIKADSVSGDLR